jgi:hypothetical protein
MSHVRGTDSSVVSTLIPSRDVRDVSKSSLLQARVLSTETGNSSIGSIMDCHAHSHPNTMKGVQLSDGSILLVKDTNHSVVLLLVELAVVLVNSVLRRPAISHPGQDVN